MRSLLKNIKESYFTNKNYTVLYFHSLVKGIGFTVMFLYIGGWLYKTGLDVEWVFLYHAAHFCLMVLFSPLSSLATRRWGLFTTYAISFFLLFLGLISLALVDKSFWFIAPGLLLSGLGFGLQGPIDLILQALYVDNHNRGRVFSVMSVISVLLSSFLVVLIGFLIDLYGFIGVCALCAVAWTLCSIVMFRLDKPEDGITTLPAVDHYKNVLGQRYRPYFILAAGYQFVIIGMVVITPLILYMATNTFTGMSSLPPSP